jgi:hypothetical protein
LQKQERENGTDERCDAAGEKPGGEYDKQYDSSWSARQVGG